MITHHTFSFSQKGGGGGGGGGGVVFWPGVTTCLDV